LVCRASQDLLVIFFPCLLCRLDDDGSMFLLTVSLLCIFQTLAVSRVRPHPPAPNSVVLGSVTRLSPLQAMLSISVVDGVPLPPGEEFTGVIRTQDVRATEKDRVKIGDCFRGGDVVRGLVASRHKACDDVVVHNVIFG